MYDSHPVLWLLHSVITLLIFILVIGVVLSWLVAFDVINLRNRFVRMAYDTTNAVMNPLLKPIRRFLPSLGGLDLSPLVLFLLLGFADRLIDYLWVTFRIPI
jgi:YggT family protein